MPRLGKDISDSGEVPSGNGWLAFDVHLCLLELVNPLFEALDALVDVLDRFVGFFLEDGADINLVADLLAYFSRNCLKDVLKFLLIMVDVPGNGPDELQTIQQGLHGVNDGFQVSPVDVLELAVKGGQKLHKVLSLGMLLAKLLICTLKTLD